MVYELINATEPMDFLVELSTQVPLLFPGILVLIWFAIMGAGYASQERRTGRGNIAIWASVSSLITTTGAFILFLYNGIIGLETVIIFVVVSIFTAMWSFFSKDTDGI